MGCNCKWTEIIIALVILVFAVWETNFSQWIIVIAAVFLFVHALICKNCGACKVEPTGTKTTAGKSTVKKAKK